MIDSFFSSNQILEISGSLDLGNELEYALEFALKYSGYDKNMNQKEIDRGCKLLYQITEDGKYCIGWGFESIPKGWSEYNFKFQIDIVSKIIRQYLEAFPLEEDGTLDGGFEKGFIMKRIKTTFGDNDGIKNSFYGIVYFKPYTCFYAK